MAAILAVLSIGLAGLGAAARLPAAFLSGGGRTALFWVGVVFFLAATWGRSG